MRRPQPLKRLSRTDSVIQEIANERRRQIEVERWDAEHDDLHDLNELARVAALYTHHAGTKSKAVPMGWPQSWDESWWKPKDQRRDLVRAAALIVAEIERLDRKSAAKAA